MKIGLAFDLKEAVPIGDGFPDDLQEEYDSPKTIDAISAVLRALGHEVVLLGDGMRLVEAVLDAPPDLVFNFAEGHGTSRSREARVPAFLELVGIPYSGSDPLTLAATLDKDCARRLASTHGIHVARGQCVGSQSEIASAVDAFSDFPVIAKPAWEGSSKGIRNKCLIHSRTELPSLVEQLLRDYRQPVLLEEFIEGDEITVGMVGNDPPRIVGVMRVIPVNSNPHFIYSLEVKRDYERQVRYECPAQLEPPVMRAVVEASKTIYQALGCRDVARVDFRVRCGVPFFLEVNPLPGLNPESSDLVLMAKLVGWTYEQLVGSVISAAIARIGERAIAPGKVATLSVVDQQNTAQCM